MPRAETARDGRSNRWRVTVWSTAALLLLAPALAMQFTHEVAWGPGDFVVFGAMLLCACGAYELVASTTRSRTYRAGAAVAIATAFLVVWANLAVGIVGAESDPANLAFFGVLGIGIVGTFVARFRPAGMARALLATATAQAAAGVAVLGTGRGPWVLVPTAMLVAAWLVSAWLFRRSSRPRGG